MISDKLNDQYLDTVALRIGAAILDFCWARIGGEFHADDLRRHVTSSIGVCAPGSADRVLRDLRQRGAINYICIRRSASLYRILSANPAFDLV